MRIVRRGNSPIFLIRVALALLCNGLLSPSASAQTYLYNRASFATGNAPSSVVAADFNGDGKLDLAVANRNDNTVSVLLGKPDASFSAKVDYATGPAPVAVVAADFNGDGKSDLAVVNSNTGGVGSVSILLGNGDGTFQSHVEYQVGANPIGIVATDFNGDKKIDLAVTNQADNSVSVLLGNGDGTFHTGTTVGVGTTPLAIASGDFNNDGRQDMVTSNRNAGSISVLLGAGDGTFTRADVSVGMAGIAIGQVIVGDFNGDGKPDVVVLQPFANQLSLLLGNGDGSFRPATSTFLRFPFSSLVVTDLNHDGKLDLMLAGTNPALAIGVLFGNGDGTFQQEVDSNAPALTSLVVGDFNGDSLLDVAGTSGQVVSVLLGNGNGTFGRSGNNFALAQSTSFGTTLVADFNGDGKPDIAVVQGGLSVLLGNGDGTFQNVRSSPLSGLGPFSVVAGDFNGDGKTDLATLSPAAPQMSVLFSNGDGTFQSSIPVPIASGLSAQTFSAGDFNGDGKADLAVVAQDNLGNTSLNILLSNGNGTFQTGAHYVFVSPFSPGQIITADFNHDGKPDLAIPNPQSSLAIMIGNGDGTFNGPVIYSVSGMAGTVAAADFNGDGRLDIAVATFTGLSVLLGNGDGTFREPPVVTSTGQGINFVSDLLTGDFNGDGKMDVANGGFVLVGNGDGTFQASTPHMLSPTSSHNAAGDFNSDGTTDLVIANSSLVVPSATVLLSAPFVSFYPAPLNFAPQQAGVPSTAQDVTLTNIGNAPLSLTSVTATGDFSETGNCSGTIAVSANCAASVVFTPSVGGLRTGTITFTDNVSTSPQLVALAGTGIVPPVGLTPAQVAFPGQLVNSASATQMVTLSNMGSAAITISSIVMSGDFAQTNTCGSSVGAASNCTINVTFTPIAAGARSGTLTVNDNASGSPQTATLSGTGIDFSVGAAPGSQTTATVTAGQTATYTLAYAGTRGFTGTVTLACTGAPAQAACSVSPSSLALNGTAAANTTVSVTTTARSITAPRTRLVPPAVTTPFLYYLWPLALLMPVIAGMVISHVAKTDREVIRRSRLEPGSGWPPVTLLEPRLVALAQWRLGLATAMFLIAIVAAISMPACGGGGAIIPPGGNPGTPAGIYTLDIKGTVTSGSATATHDISLKLTVN